MMNLSPTQIHRPTGYRKERPTIGFLNSEIHCDWALWPWLGMVDAARQIRTHNILCDVLHIDCYWQRWGRWSEMLWDQKAYPDPAGMIRELKAMGFKICLWINSYIGIESERFTEAKEQGYFLKTAQGDVYVLPL